MHSQSMDNFIWKTATATSFSNSRKNTRKRIRKIILSVFNGWTQASHLIDAQACVYEDLDARSRHTKSARKVASYVLIPFKNVHQEVVWVAHLMKVFWIEFNTTLAKMNVSIPSAAFVTSLGYNEWCPGENKVQKEDNWSFSKQVRATFCTRQHETVQKMTH